MPPPGVPRIGRRDLYQQQPRRGVPTFRPDPIQRALTPDADLIAQLAPLPAALYEIAKRVRVHCGREADVTLAQQLDNLQERAWQVWLAVGELSHQARKDNGLRGRAEAELGKGRELMPGLYEPGGVEAINKLRETIQEFNQKATEQTTSLVRLTWAIAILTLVMAVGLGLQIYLSLGSCS